MAEQSATSPAPPEKATVTTSTRNLDDTAPRLCEWLARVLPEGADPQIVSLHRPESNGLSSETILVDATWLEDGTRTEHPLVIRVAPDPGNMPVFPTYDMESQFEILRILGDRGTVPVPKVYWSEPDPGPLGGAFFVMGRIEGRVPPDVMPYNFGDSWVFDAGPEERRQLQDASIALLADLHAIEQPHEVFPFLVSDLPGETPLRQHFAGQLDYYEWHKQTGPASPLVDRAIAWLQDNWPADEGETVLSWGDSRIGNVMYDGFTPVAVLDWEMAGLAPREVDLAWMFYLHRFFEEIAHVYGLPGLPDMFRFDDVVETYTRLTGHEPRDMEWYLVYTALRYAVVSLRTSSRGVHFGDRPAPEDPDDLIMHRAAMEKMVDGSYWATLRD